MSVVPPCFAATPSPCRTPHGLLRSVHRLSLLAGLSLALGGCRSHPVAPATSISPVRSLTGPSATVLQVQASPLYRQARADCKRRDYRQAADHLQTLARPPGLAPDALAFVQQQRRLCLQDAGLATPSSPVMPASLPARTPSDGDCGPRALLLLCRKLGVPATLDQLRTAAGTNSQGTTLAGLQQAATSLGLKAEGVQVSREALPDTALPALAWVHRDHYVALLALSGSGETATATLRDPNHAAEETLSQEQLLQRCGGVLLLVHR